VVPQRLADIGAAAGDGAVARGVEAKRFMGELLHERDDGGAAMLTERAPGGHAAEDFLHGVAADVGGLATHAAVILDRFAAT
jgi:hypothetical protein